MGEIIEEFIEVPSEKFIVITINSPEDIPEEVPQGNVRIKYNSDKVKLNDIRHLVTDKVSVVDTYEKELVRRTESNFYTYDSLYTLLEKYISETKEDVGKLPKLKALLERLER